MVASIVVMLFSPLVLQGVNASSPLEAKRSNIPIALPIETSTGGSALVAEKDSFRHFGPMQGSTSQIANNDSISTLLTCNNIPITSVSASGDDGNVPSNVLDNNLNTRWSNLGQGSWIQLDLGSKKSICSVDIAWYRGDLRTNNFVISVSDDANTFTQKHSGTSSGTTTSPEKYTLPAGTEGRYVRITVNGNTENNWASITEVDIFGAAGGPVTDPGSLYHKWQSTAGSTSSWSAWTSVGGDLISNPSVIANQDGRLEAFVVSSSNELYHKWQTSPGSATWSAWHSLGGVIRSDSEVAVARNSDGRLEVFVIHGTQNSLYHKWQTSAGSNTWSSWHSLGGVIRSDSNIAVAANSDGRLEVFVIGSGNWLYHKSQTSAGTNSWSSWVSLGGNVRANSDPAVIANEDGRLEAFVVDGPTNSLHHKWQTSAGSNTWSAWHSLGGVIRSDSNIAVARNSDGRLEAFVIGSGNWLFHKSQTS
jgi:hypothetical protein